MPKIAAFFVPYSVVPPPASFLLETISIMNPPLVLSIIFILFLFSGIRIIYEYKRALKFRFGSYVKTLKPGFRWVIPLVETIQIVDIRVITINIISQEVMTEDNVPCSIDGVVFFKINDPEKAVLEVEEFKLSPNCHKPPFVMSVVR